MPLIKLIHNYCVVIVAYELPPNIAVLLVCLHPVRVTSPHYVIVSRPTNDVTSLYAGVSDDFNISPLKGPENNVLANEQWTWIEQKIKASTLVHAHTHTNPHTHPHTHTHTHPHTHVIRVYWAMLYTVMLRVIWY